MPPKETHTDKLHKFLATRARLLQVSYTPRNNEHYGTEEDKYDGRCGENQLQMVKVIE